jgi:hypothetical protein
MDEFDHPHGRADNEIGQTTILTIFAAGLSLFACLLSLSEVAQIGPDIGEIVSFDPQNGPRYWSQPGIPAVYVKSSGDVTPRGCILMPPVLAADGGSFVIEAKETTRPPSFRVHWSGLHTALDSADCGRSADLVLQLTQLRALATVAGGFGAGHGFGLF